MSSEKQPIHDIEAPTPALDAQIDEQSKTPQISPSEPPPLETFDAPVTEEILRRTPSAQRRLIQHIGPVVLDRYGIDVVADFGLDELKLHHLLHTKMVARQIIRRLEFTSPWRMFNAQSRLLEKMCQAIPENDRDTLLEELRAKLAEESRATEVEPSTDHPGVVINRLRHDLMKQGRAVRIDDLAKAMANQTDNSSPRLVWDTKYDLRRFLEGQKYLRPYRLEALLEILGIAEEQETLITDYKRNYNKIYGSANRPSHREMYSSSPFRKPSNEFEKRSPGGERREYIKRIGPIALRHRVNLIEHLTPWEIELCVRLKTAKTAQEIASDLGYQGHTAISYFQAQIVDKIHYALPEDKRDEITAAVRTEISRELCCIPKDDPDPNHIGPLINELRHHLLEWEKAAEFDTLVRRTGIARNDLARFLQGLTYLTPTRVLDVLVEMGATIGQIIQGYERYNVSYKRMRSRAYAKGEITKKKNKTAG